MIIILVTSATWFTIAIGVFFDPSTIDYCQLTCNNNGEVSSGCAGRKCYKHKDKQEIVQDMVAFRQQTLDTHNDLRNKFANGQDSNTIYPTAANMHVVNYDLELEHLARCYIMGDFANGHDTCRLTSYCKNNLDPGQNLFGLSMKNTSLACVDTAIRSWYSESSEIPENEREDVVTKFHSIMVYGAGHFTQLVWGSVTRIGCVRAWYPTNPQTPAFKYVLACNYAATDEMCPGNIIGMPMYAIGEPCTMCGNEKCNNELGGKYDGLCGESEPAPLNEPTKLGMKNLKGIAEGSTNMSNGFFILVCVIAVNLICCKVLSLM